MDHGRRKDLRLVPLFLLPGLIVYGALYLFPGLYAFRISVFDWSGVATGSRKFLGLGHFAEVILRDPWFRVSVRNTFMIMVGGGMVLFALALFFAMALTSPRTQGKRFFRMVFFLPYVLPAIAVAILWTFALNPKFGVVNVALRSVGLGRFARAWLGTGPTAVASIAFVTIWTAVGFFMILFICAIGDIPVDLFDAARVDGAAEWQVFRYVTFPLLRDIMTIGIILWMIWALRLFGIPFAMTRGNPARSTHTITTYMVDNAYPYSGSANRFGYATAIAVLLFALVGALSVLYFAIRSREAIEF